jgi:hypothetical protein
MKLEAPTLSMVAKCLTPRNNMWLKKALVLFAFILMDYTVTLIFCKTPMEEGNGLARSFMEAYGIPLGLTLFDLLANFPIYMILCLNSHLVNLPPRLANIAETFVDVVFAWFIAGLHFNGAASWFWFAPDVLRQAAGAFLYFIVAFVVLWEKHA